MYSYNRIHIIGYQTQPVEIRQTPSGTSVTDLNLVVPYSFKDQSGAQQTGKSFHTVTVWGGMADIAGQYLNPGSQVFVSGRLQTDSWDDTKSGEKRSKTKIVALDMIMLDPKDGQLPAIQEASLVTDAVNTAEIVGNATRDPEVRTTTSGQQVVSLGIATNDRWKDKSGENQERSEFHNVVVWGDLAQEVSKYIKKGMRVYVSGRVQTRSWETQSGEKRYTTEVIAERVSLLGIASSVAQETVQSSGTARPAATPTEKASPADAAKPAPAPSAETPAAPEGVTVPDVQYKSEVKVEDLPF